MPSLGMDPLPSLLRWDFTIVISLVIIVIMGEWEETHRDKVLKRLDTRRYRQSSM